MRFGISAFLTDKSIGPAELAREAEARGFSSLYVPEHTHIPVSRRTPYPMGGDLPEEYWRTLDPFVALTAAASVSSLTVGTAVCLVAQHDPIVLAKQVATMCHLFPGRFVFGVGYGWNVEELADHGVAFASRREVLRERVLAMRALWTQDEASFEGTHVSFGPAYAWPKPPVLPRVLIGGAGGPKLWSAIAEFADGWMPIGGRGLSASLPVLKDAFAAAGRTSAPVVVPLGSTPEPGKIEHFAELGVEETVLPLPSGTRDVVLPVLDSYASRIGELVG